ncbi:MAG: DUF2905 domain-containing protein [Candidatus Hydrogenedentota bacterium]
MRDTGLVLILIGAFVLLMGIVLYVGPSAGLGKLGRLPGDIRLDWGSIKLYFPITTSILVSVLLTLLLFLFTRLR